MTEYQAIENAYIRNRYGWDYLHQVKWDMLQNNLQATRNILDNPQKFPKADVEALREAETELELFLTLRG